jgi:hypothetical protein
MKIKSQIKGSKAMPSVAARLAGGGDLEDDPRASPAATGFMALFDYMHATSPVAVRLAGVLARSGSKIRRLGCVR